MTESQYKVLANNLPDKLNNKELKKLAKKIPKSVHVVKVTKLGKEILDNNLCPEQERKHILPHQLYDRTETRDINHGRRLRMAYKRNGVAGIKAYLRAFLKHHKEMMQFERGDIKRSVRKPKLIVQ